MQVSLNYSTVLFIKIVFAYLKKYVEIEKKLVANVNDSFVSCQMEHF